MQAAALSTDSSKPRASKAVYFPGLNALRYIAAASVVFCHVEEVKLHYHLPSYYHFFLFHGAGALAVSFFFVLSGFLITYLLLKEKETCQDVNVRSFYMRRALRIWPVYYLISLLGLFVLPHVSALAFPVESAKVLSQYPINALLYIFFMPNVALWLNFFVPYASQLWSVGVEEQFYLFWPWLFKLLKKPLAAMVGLVVLFTVMRLVFHFSGISLPSGNLQKAVTYLYNFLNYTRIDCMAVGGIGGYLIYSQNTWFRHYCLNRTVEIGALVGVLMYFVLTSTFVTFDISYIDSPVYSVFFLLILVNVACSEQSLLRLEGRLWTFLGNISYSIYMYQYLAIGAVLLVFRNAQQLTFNPVYNTLFHVACQCVVVGLAYVSYTYFEMPFLKLKNKYALVKSTTDPTPGQQSADSQAVHAPVAGATVPSTAA